MSSKPRPPIEEVGKRYGMLVVLSLERQASNPSRKRSRYSVMCRCDCGNEKDILLNSLRRGSTKSCGCRRDQYDKMRGKNSSQFTGYEGITGTFWKGYRDGAKRRGIEFDLKIEEAWDLFLEQEGICALSGVPLCFGANAPMAATTASIDRIDNDKGYSKENIQWVHKTMNLMRNVLSVEEFKDWCRKVSEYAD